MMKNTETAKILEIIERGQSLRACSVENAVEVPAELLLRCLSFADWGSLAKLANTQSQWKDLMYEVADLSNESRWHLAQSLFEGTNGLEKNPEKAMELFLQLANVPRNEETNMPILNDNADGDDDTNTADSSNCFAPAMRKIADLYFVGEGVEKADPAMGCAWLKAAHSYGSDPEAAHELAVSYEHGRHNVEVDVVEAAVWFRKGAEAGHVESMTELALCYELGCGVEQDDELALDWYMAAAEKGHVTAKYSVGEAFEAARGVPQSDQEACLWYYKAAVDGCKDSATALRRLEDIARIVVPGVRSILESDNRDAEAVALEV